MLYDQDPDQASFAVSEMHLHENYDSYTVLNDICMLTLEGEADFSSDFIGAINLPDDHEEYESGTDCIVSGWGTTTSG